MSQLRFAYFAIGIGIVSFLILWVAVYLWATTAATSSAAPSGLGPYLLPSYELSCRSGHVVVLVPVRVEGGTSGTAITCARLEDVHAEEK